MSQSNFDHHITIFSPQGHIYQIGISQEHLVSCFVVCRKFEGRLMAHFVMCSILRICNESCFGRWQHCHCYSRQEFFSFYHTAKSAGKIFFDSRGFGVMQFWVQDRLIDPSSLTNIFRITDTVGVLMLGLLRKLLYRICGSCSLSRSFFS